MPFFPTAEKKKTVAGGDSFLRPIEAHPQKTVHRNRRFLHQIGIPIIPIMQSGGIKEGTPCLQPHMTAFTREIPGAVPRRFTASSCIQPIG